MDVINDYYDVNLKYARLDNLGIQARHCEYNDKIQSSTFQNHRFYKIDLADKEAMVRLFEAEKFDAVCNLAAQAGIRYSIENSDSYIHSNIIGFMNILECCRHYGVKNLSYASQYPATLSYNRQN